MAVDDEAFEAYKRRVAGVYDRAAPLYGQAGIPFFQHAGQRLVEVAGVSPSSRVLDVAAGRGAVLFPAAERVGASGRAVGIDLSEAMVRETAADITRRGVANAEMHQMDAEKLAFQDGAFDFVLCSFALFFFPRLEQALAEFRRVLRSGGTVGIGHGGAESDPRWKWENEVLKRYPVPEPMNRLPDCMLRRSFHRPGDLNRLLAGAGFVAVREHVEWAEFTFQDEEDWWRSRWTHGSRVPLEQMAPEQLAGYRRDAFGQLRGLEAEGGLTQRVQLLFGLGAKSAPLVC